MTAPLHTMDEPRDVWVFLSEMAGQIAMWAVRQSPYAVPDNLELVLRKFQESAGPHFDVAREHKGGMRVFRTWREIEEFLETHLLAIPEVKAWNSPKNTVPVGDVRGPDDDFVDLWALSTNVALGILRENATRDTRRVEEAVS